MLIIDVGTNGGEILLGNRQGVYSASSPTGPAFEERTDCPRDARGGRAIEARAHRPGDA